MNLNPETLAAALLALPPEDRAQLAAALLGRPAEGRARLVALPSGKPWACPDAIRDGRTEGAGART